MEKRRAPRFSAELPVAVTVLGEQELRCQGVVKNASGVGVGIEFPAFVAPGAAIKIELDNCLFLGEVVFCRPSGDAYFLGIQIDQALNGLAELASALRGFWEDEQPARAESPNSTAP